jgi:DNA-binding transcriptional ArsR family regulator
MSTSMAQDQLSLTFAALADPTRRAILERLTEGEATVNDLAGPFDMSLQAVSKHLKVLQRAGLVSRGRQAQWRPARLRGGPLGEAANWLLRYRDFWEASMDSLDQYLQAVQRVSDRDQKAERTDQEASG